MRVVCPKTLHLATVLILISTTSWGCGLTAPTKYEPLGQKGGYQDSALQENLYHVEFIGNGYTTLGTAREYWLYRCAEITVENGHDYFEITEGNARSETFGLAMGGFGSVASKPRFEGIIRLHSGEMPEGREDLFDARELMAMLDANIKR